MTPEQQANARAWAQTIRQAHDLDPAIREALRPVYDRLKAEAPHTAAALSLAMIARALKMLDAKDDPARVGEYRRAVAALALELSDEWSN